ncbi:MAG: hypothetical protein P4M14_06855 [Gammaproteobacteria bacterium]|nr:hypothetical protein [Gammaproteobacteria bacterium]
MDGFVLYLYNTTTGLLPLNPGRTYQWMYEAQIAARSYRDKHPQFDVYVMDAVFASYPPEMQDRLFNELSPIINMT